MTEIPPNRNNFLVLSMKEGGLVELFDEYTKKTVYIRITKIRGSRCKVGFSLPKHIRCARYDNSGNPVQKRQPGQDPSVVDQSKIEHNRDNLRDDREQTDL